MTVNVTCEDCAGRNIYISYRTVLRKKKKDIFSARFESPGRIQAELNLTDTVAIDLRIEGRDTTWFLSRVYLEPNSTLDINVVEGVFQFKGALASLNTVLQKSLEIYKQGHVFRLQHQDDVVGTLRAQEGYLSVIESFGADLNAEIESDPLLSRYYKDLAININLQLVTEERLNFEFRNLLKNNSLITTHDKKPHRSKPSPPNFFAGVSLNPYLLRFKSSGYVDYLGQVVNLKLRDAFDFYWENVDQDKIGRYEFLKMEIAKNSYLSTCADFFLALCLSRDRFLGGIDFSELSQAISNFENDYPTSPYLLELKDILKENRELKEGMPSKDFSMLDLSGKEFRLSDFKGSAVYIDIWATWCAPCIEEFKYSKILMKKYQDRKDLIFLFVSKDIKQNLWKSFLRENPSLNGIHGIQPPNYERYDENDIMHLYKINGIPRYILIAKDGRIINYNAPRPSELIENHDLDSLLSF